MHSSPNASSSFSVLVQRQNSGGKLEPLHSLLAFPKNLSQPTHVRDCRVQKACIIKQLRSAAYCLWEGQFLEEEDCPQAVQVFVGRVPSASISLLQLRQADTEFSTSPNSALGHCTRSVFQNS